MTARLSPGPFWRAEQPLVLASGSLTRKALLESAGISPVIEPARIDERALEAQAGAAPPQDVALILADAKALAVSTNRPGALVLGADQTLECEGVALHKPANLAEARDQLRRLSGRDHRLHSALALARDGDLLWRHVESATLRMRQLGEDFLDRYLASQGEAALASVGAYQLEGPGIQLFERVEGDHSTILGLPLLPLLGYLRQIGALYA